MAGRPLDRGTNAGNYFQQYGANFILSPRVLGFENGVEQLELFSCHLVTMKYENLLGEFG